MAPPPQGRILSICHRPRSQLTTLASLQSTWLLINAASAKLQHHPHRAVLPSHFKFPSFFHPLLDGENGPSPESPIPFQATSNSPSSSHSHRLIPPSRPHRQSPPQAQAAVSSLVSALAFPDVFQSASDTGKARLLDGSTQHGPSAWLVRIPITQSGEVSLFRAGD